jgi:hypothetical protein
MPSTAEPLATWLPKQKLVAGMRFKAAGKAWEALPLEDRKYYEDLSAKEVFAWREAALEKECLGLDSLATL